MVFDPSSEFANFLRGKNQLADEANSLTQTRDERTFRKLWETSELSANDFADKVAEFFKLPRVSLPDLLAAPALAKQFSPRFLREMSVFPYRSADGAAMLAVADPSDFAAVRAAAIVLGAEVNVSIASFEDVETILDQRLVDEEVSSSSAGEAPGARDDVSRACATSRAERRLFGPSMICSKKLSSCAPATFTLSRSEPVWLCACGSTNCCATCQSPRTPYRKPLFLASRS